MDQVQYQAVGQGHAGGPAALAIAHVSHAFGARKALDDVSLTVPQGRFVALLGLNGAGKTTLFSLVTRLYDNVSGRIEIFGHDLRRKPKAALARLGVVFQAKTLDPELTVLQNFTYHAALHGYGKAEGRRRAEHLLERVGLADRLGDKVRNLSGGQSRRIEIARALLHEPRLLILDEPTVGLDIKARAGIVEVVRGLIRDEGLSVLWTTHLFDEIQDGDQVVLLHKGRIVASGTRDEIVATAASSGATGAAGADSLPAAFRVLTGTTAEEGL